MASYFSRYPEVIQLSSTTSSAIIAAMKTIFLRHGIPQTLVSDNGPQLTSSEMKQFAANYGFQHVTTSSYHPQSNGLVERMVQTVKKLISETDDSCLTLLSYRALPWCNLSPSELLMGRRVRTDVSQSVKSLTPNWSHLISFAQNDREYKNQQKRNFDKCHRAHPLPFLPERAAVWVNTQGRQTPGQVVGPANTPRSYVIDVPSGQIRRNHSNLNQRAEEPSQPTSTAVTERRPTTRFQTGVPLHPPDHLTYWKRGDMVRFQHYCSNILRCKFSVILTSCY